MFIDNIEQKELDLASTLNTSTKNVQKPNTKSIQGWRRGGVSLIKHRLTTETKAQQMDSFHIFLNGNLYFSGV